MLAQSGGGVAAQGGTAAKLKSSDVITIAVFGEASLSGDFQVSQSGTINYPLLGQIEVMGKTADEVEKEIEVLLERDYIRDAQVAVDLVKRRANSVMVIGQVRRPGPVEFAAGTSMDLFTAIASAGGPAEENSDTSKIEIKRRSGDSIETIFASLEVQKELRLVDSDTVIVKPKAVADLKFFTVLGEVAKPGTFQMIPDRQMDILSALAIAGGLAPTARPTRVTVRNENGESKVVNVSQMQKAEIPPLIVKPGDTIFVPESFF